MSKRNRNRNAKNVNVVDKMKFGITNVEYRGESIEEGAENDTVQLKKAFKIFNEMYFGNKLSPSEIDITKLRKDYRVDSNKERVKKGFTDECYTIRIHEKIIGENKPYIYMILIRAMIQQLELEEKEAAAGAGQKRGMGYESGTGNYFTRRYVDLCEKIGLKCTREIEEPDKLEDEKDSDKDKEEGLIELEDEQESDKKKAKKEPGKLKVEPGDEFAAMLESKKLLDYDFVVRDKEQSLQKIPRMSKYVCSNCGREAFALPGVTLKCLSEPDCLKTEYMKVAEK